MSLISINRLPFSVCLTRSTDGRKTYRIFDLETNNPARDKHGDFLDGGGYPGDKILVALAFATRLNWERGLFFSAGFDGVAASDVTANDACDGESAPLGKSAVGALCYLLKRDPALCTTDEVESELDICRSTAGKALKALIEAKYAYRPGRGRKGVAITESGRAIARKLCAN